MQRPETPIGAENGAPPGRPGSLEDLRGRNVVRIVRALRDAGQASRADIARTTGISRTTVSGAIADLVRGGWVREVGGAGAPTSQGGRPPLLVSLEPLAGLAVGIDFDHDRLRVAVADLERRVRAGHEIELDVDGDGERSLDVAAELARDAVRRTGVAPERVIGVGLSVPAPVAPGSGIVLEPEILPGWASLDPAAEMAARLSWPVQADNDANLGALAEATWGAARGARECLFVQLRAGVGAGLLLHGEIYRGTAGAAGELGHVQVDDRGRLCGCGNRGCLQTVASEPAILELLRRAGRTERSITEVVDAAQAGDRLCRRVLEDAGRHIGRALAMACNVLNPERVVIGSDMRLAGDLLLGPAREELRRRVLGATEAAVEIVPGELGSAAAVQGALALVLLATEEHIAARVLRGSTG